MKKLAILFIVALLPVFHLLNATQIKGKVTDESNQPLPGVTVSIQGTTQGTVTDMDGKFTLNTADSNAVLVFQYIGYEDSYVSLNGQKQMQVTLVQSTSKLEEVMVVGYGVHVRGMRKSMVPASYIAPAPSPEYNTEGYSTIHENGFRKVTDAPLSTFSIDVDAASYSNIRRFLSQGKKPPVDAVRIEEMINYFNYDYAEPTGEVPFSVTYEMATCPWNEKNKLIHVGLQGKHIETRNLPASNLVFLIDVSGSMNEANKLPLLKQSFKLLVNQLRDKDHVAIVVYAGSSGLVLPSTPGNQKEKILEAIERLQAGGSTAGAEGLELAYKVAASNLIEDGNNRIILATDGDFNVGPSSNAEMERMIERERERGIFISVLGFGMGNYKDDKMEIIADKGNGNYSYIDNLLEAKKVLINEFGGTLFTIAKDVKIQIEFNPALVKSYRLVGYENRLLNDEDFDDDRKDAGEMGAGHSVTALYEIELADENTTEGRKLKYQQTEIKPNALVSNEVGTIKLRYKNPDSNKSQLLERTMAYETTSIDDSSENFRFSSAVAGFGMLLRNSEYINHLGYPRVIELAKGSKGIDDGGYRAEFIQLIELAREL